MARSKKGGRSSTGSKQAPPPQSSGQPHDAASLIEKAHTLLAQSNFELAIKFLERALEVEPTHAEAKELLGIAELEGGDAERGRECLIQLLPPHAPEAPAHPSPYLYLAQSAENPQEALGYYTTAAAMLEKIISAEEADAREKEKQVSGGEEVEDAVAEERKMAVNALLAMIEIWMSDLCMEESAEGNCDALISRALSILPNDPEARLSLASIRMSQSRFDEAKAIAMRLYNDFEGREAFDPILPPLPVRLALARLLLEHHEHLPALDIVSTIREEDTLNVEGAYLEGWALYLRAEALIENPALIQSDPAPISTPGEDLEEPEEPMSAEECLSEAMRSLIECAKLYADEDYLDEGIGAHVAELLEELEKRGVTPAMNDVEDDEDVEMQG
ncbi:hypothetical protein CNBF2810 [Cryptococcus deneoformans B-3501A]|uniref:Uncharacterized protein n=1 Tax=Cryptococcus deneoformans (strain JEC21 / ATCC MYA-565) TaxID=214684 RepID=Q5KFF9_CRYD1|nr:conserved hypothetical protein [Cryptococcus neoformans var. neoformans JEC21]XP_774601.1 hypothetical protein CNBF2810 [Cryptococcus neoformans var. neoformans B-3501A]AAW44010.1 conserved hypothetical protein [Cryptococcus neoformans var. neoformans JEC21]EAL19954.1 hypothetical protein CNBF2810 [Cryptococcus neoformans var. neoformans B-3501A]